MVALITALPAADSVEAFARYQIKRKMCYGVDPYSVKTVQTDIPLNVTFPKIYQFLVLDPNPFTGEPKDCSKAMDAILFFKNGWVKNLAGGKVQDMYIVHGKVHHSFALNEKPLEPWIIVQEDGTIQAAHCTCAIGLLEACRHVGATLFALDGVRTAVLEKKLSVTDLPAYWKKPPASITNNLYKPIAEVDLGRKITRNFTVRDTASISASNQSRCCDLLNNLKADGMHVAGMSLFCGDPQVDFECSSCDDDKRVADKLESFDLSKYFNERFKGKSIHELRNIADSIFHQLPRKRELIQLVEQHTLGQKNSKWWMMLRVGRITASVLKEVCCTFPNKPSLSLVRKICYPDQTRFSTPSVKYGIKHEERAVEQLYKAIMHTHVNVSRHQSGLIIPENEPHLAASPDAIVKCDCHGLITVEVKCPYSARQNEDIINVLMSFKDPYIRRDHNGNVTLNTHHKYFLQALMQVHVANAAFGYFYVWAPKNSLIFEVKTNDEYWSYCKRKATVFHKNVIIPELLSKCYTAQKT
ncbi:uncharacterized protein LOC135698888 [Ochlerotatus camptorhynchus]|uniref:uncharacterized protein LOC135698888 n=1 Tax=Ochlerotatus camptorhynchus TaxID=644619 RepID=UPI0031CDF58A